MSERKEKPSWKIQLLMIIAGITSWPLGLVICYMFNDVIDEKKRYALDLLEKYSKAFMRLEIFFLVLYAIIIICGLALGEDLSDLVLGTILNI